MNPLQTIRKIKIPIRRMSNKEILIFLFFLLLSFCFWLLTLFRATVEQKIVVQPTLSDVPGYIILTDTLPESIEVVVRDKGREIVTYLFDNGADFSIPFANIRIDKEHLTIDNRVLEQALKKGLSPTCEVLSISPSSISLAYSKGVGKRLPVKLNAQIHPSNYTMVAGEIIVNPDSIMVYAPASVLSTLYYVETQKVQYLNVDDTIQETLQLIPIKHGKLEQKTVSLFVPIERYTQKIIEVPIFASNVPEGYRLQVFPQKVQVSCFINLSAFNQLDADDIEVSLVFSPENHASRRMQAITLTHTPRWIKNIRLETDSVEVILERIVEKATP